MKKILIAPSLLSANFMDLKAEIDTCIQAGTN